MKQKPKANNQVRGRIAFIAVAFSLFFLLIAAKTVHLQVYQHEWLAEKAEGQYEKSLKVCGKRGTIYDARLNEMAVSLDVKSVAAYPTRIADKRQAARALAVALDMKSSFLARKLKGERSFSWVKRKVSPQEVTAVQALELSGIDFIPEHSRFYPGRALAGQVIGLAGIDGRGLEGVEFHYQQVLEGSDFNYKVLQDARGCSFDMERKYDLEYSGNNLVLTIDRAIQYIAEAGLAQAVEEHHAKSGLVVAMNPKTGAILAMAHYPFFNPNAFGQFDREIWRNRAVTDAFEPGSTMKIFMAAAALESGVCTPSTIFFCENGSYRVGSNVVHDTHEHGWLSLQQIVKFSSNIGAVKVGEMIGAENLYRTLASFGFGKKTGIDFPGETEGRLSPHKQWTKIDAGAVAFGHGLSVSAVQLATAVSAIANGGLLMRPYLVQAVTDPHGRVIETTAPRQAGRAASKATAETVKRILATVVTEEGTGVEAAIDGYQVCGKTGTARKLENGRYTRGKYLASFVGFAPAEDPAVTVLVLIDEPQKGYYGGLVAAPAFRRITHEILNYLDIPPKHDQQRFRVSRDTEVCG